MAGAEGIEPSSAVLETDILPLNYAPKYLILPVFCTDRRYNSPQQDTTPIQKSKWKYYNIFYFDTQEHFHKHAYKHI